MTRAHGTPENRDAVRDLVKKGKIAPIEAKITVSTARTGTTTRYL
jgi:hypothetical protein